MTSLQQSLQQRHEVLAANMDRIDSPRIATSIHKLKAALQELQTRNAHLVMRNEKLNAPLSFMPPEMWKVVATTTKEQSQDYERQWADPHYLHLSAGEYRFMQCEPGGGIVADRMRRHSRRQNVWREDNSSSDNTSYKSSRWNSRLQVCNNAKGKGKGKPFKKGKRDHNDPYWTIPEFGKAIGDARVVIFTMTDLVQTTNLYRREIPTLLEKSNLPGYVVHLPDPAFVASRRRPDQQHDQSLTMAYHNALKALYQLTDSPRLYYFMMK